MADQSFSAIIFKSTDKTDYSKFRDRNDARFPAIATSSCLKIIFQKTRNAAKNNRQRVRVKPVDYVLLIFQNNGAYSILFCFIKMIYPQRPNRRGDPDLQGTFCHSFVLQGLMDVNSLKAFIRYRCFFGDASRKRGDHSLHKICDSSQAGMRKYKNADWKLSDNFIKIPNKA